jgi:hypothetical protein
VIISFSVRQKQIIQKLMLATPGPLDDDEAVQGNRGR